MKTITYLAGDVSRPPQGEKSWREKVIFECKDCSIEFRCPDESILYSPQSMAKHHKRDQEFHTVDLWHVEDSRVVFAFFDRNSKSRYAGTSGEICYAKALGKKHIIIVSTLTRGMAHYYEFPFRMANKFFTSLEDGISHLRRISIKYNGEAE